MTRREALKALGAGFLACLAPAWLIQGAAVDPDAPLSPEELAELNRILSRYYGAALERLIPEELSIQRLVGRQGPVYLMPDRPREEPDYRKEIFCKAP